MLKLAFYTCFYGGPENPAYRVPVAPSDKYPCFYITNNSDMVQQLAGTRWVPVFDDTPTADNVIESNMVAKRVKTTPHTFPVLRDFDYLCFLDSKLEHVDEHKVELLIDRHFVEQNLAVLMRQHPFVPDSVLFEFRISMNQPRYQLEHDKIARYIESQVQSGLAVTTGYHCACGFIIRNMKHPQTNVIGDMWLEHIQQCGIQDQISFFFVKQHFRGVIYAFTEVPFVNA